MRIKGLFWILTALLLSVLAIITYHAFYTESVSLFFLVEGLVLLTVLYLSVFYRRIIKPLHIIGNGMEVLKEQDFSSRLSRVGQKEADRIVDIFNKMMEQLKNERLHLREQNHLYESFYHEFCRCGPHTGTASQGTTAEYCCFFMQTFYGNGLSEQEYPDRDGAGSRFADCQSGQFSLRAGVGQHYQERFRID